MLRPLNLLLVEDNPSDAELLLRQLRQAGFEPAWRRVDTAEAYAESLHAGLDLILSDYHMPMFDAPRALELLRESGLAIPFIIVSGLIGEDIAVSAMKQGAADYFLKDRLARLGPAIEHALEESRLRRERVLSDESVRRANEQLRALTSRLENVREQERTSIAREIHDVLAQELTRLKIDLVWIARRLARPAEEGERPGLAARIADAVKQTDVAISTVQRIATELRPVILDSLGLYAAVEWQTEEFAKRTGLVGRAIAPRGECAVDRERATALFRILQESLTNIARHAGAGAVDVVLEESAEALTLTVRDDGCGIAPAQLADPLAIGLVGMRERAQAFGGALRITGVEGKGTMVSVRLPRTTGG